jgi:pimeloyl-ACP methyl ester carboxylesterase
MPYFTSDGTNLFVDVSGSGSPLLMLHELTLDHRQWTAQKEALRGHCRVFRMDLRDHGRSARTASGHTGKGWAADVQRGLVQFGMDRHNPGKLIAHGFACEAALQVALSEPRRLHALLLVAPIVWGAPLSTEWQDLWRSLQQNMEREDLEAVLHRLRQDPSYAGVCAVAALERAVTEMQQNFSGGPLHTTERDEGTPTFERLSECQTPTLVLIGSKDRPDFKEIAAAVAQRLPTARLQECEGAAHFPNLEAPEAFNQIVLDWLAEKTPHT